MGNLRVECTRSRRKTRAVGSGSAAKPISCGAIDGSNRRVDDSQAKDSEQYETVASGWRRRLLGVFAILAVVLAVLGLWSRLGPSLHRTPAVPRQHRAVRAGTDRRAVRVAPRSVSRGSENARPKPTRTPRSPVGHTSSRRSAKIMNMSAVHGPMPRTCVNFAVTVLVGQPAEHRQVERARLDSLREIDDRRRLGGRQTGGAQRLGRRRADRRRGERRADAHTQPAPDRVGGRTGQLLRHDRLGQRLEALARRRLGAEPARPDTRSTSSAMTGCSAASCIAGVAGTTHRAHSLEATALGVTFILGAYSSTAISRAVPATLARSCSRHFRHGP